MRKKLNARTATMILVMLWLLSSINMNTYAENIPISEEGLQKIGTNKIRLENGIGVIVFNLTKTGDQLLSDGYLTMSNTYNTSVTMHCSIITKLSTVDLDENNEPRIHETISDNIIFKPIPDPSWLTLETNQATIEPFSIYNFRYKVKIPFQNNFNNSIGYLVYIHITKTMENATGANIGIDYNYKLFIIFTGEKNSFVISQYIIYAIPVISIIGLISIYKTKKKHAKKIVKINKKPEPIKTVYYTKLNEEKTTRLSDDVDINQKIDKLLGGKYG